MPNRKTKTDEKAVKAALMSTAPAAFDESVLNTLTSRSVAHVTIRINTFGGILAAD